MKMFLGNTPMKSLNIKHFEMNTNDCTMVPSDLQAGVTAVARGQKIVGTGKSFEFANYGKLKTNSSRYVPSNINIIELASSEHPIVLTLDLGDMKTVDFSTPKKVASVVVDGESYDLEVSVQSNILKVSCEHTFYLQVFYGKDNYV